MDNTEPRSFLIVAGPNRDHLLDSFKYVYDNRAIIPIDFTVVRTTDYSRTPAKLEKFEVTNVEIQRIGYQDWTGRTFELSGCCGLDLWPREDQDTAIVYRFEAIYDPISRSGSITIFNLQ